MRGASPLAGLYVSKLDVRYDNHIIGHESVWQYRTSGDRVTAILRVGNFPTTRFPLWAGPLTTIKLARPEYPES